MPVNGGRWVAADGAASGGVRPVVVLLLMVADLYLG